MTRNISKEGLTFIEKHEGFVPYVYDDADKGKKKKEWDGTSKPKGTLAIGFGHTNKGAHSLRIEKGLKITKEKAREVLKADVQGAEKIVNGAIKGPLEQHQFDALVS